MNTSPKARGQGLPISAKTRKTYSWEQFQRPAIYEIVCKKSGNRYVGASSRPDLRRAAYWFHLKAPSVLTAANPFFGSKKLLIDLEKHGIDSFEFNIIQQLPVGSAKKDLVETKHRIMLSIDQNKLYNKGDKLSLSQFAEIDEEMSKMVEDYHEATRLAQSALNTLENVKYINRVQLTNLSRERNLGTMTASQFDAIYAEMQDLRKVALADHRALKSKAKSMKVAIRDKNALLLKKYR